MYSQRFTWLVMGACGGLLLLTGAALAEGDAKGGIAPQPLTNALAEFAEQSGLQLVYLTELTEGIETEGAEPTEMPERVLDQLLADTGLRYEFINDRTVSIEPKQTSSNANPESRSLGNSQPALNSVLMAQNQTPALQSQISQSIQTGSSDDDANPFLIDEIIVTGTNLRGITNTASPLIQFDRKDIEASGVPTAAEFIRRAVPQNFARGAAEDQFGTVRSGVANVGSGSGVNLRGLGNSSTLVLLNGRRLAASGLGAFADVSMIPLTAIDRIDIITDGASAVYGSDAVGGVVNFVLTDDFEGAETRARLGPDLGNDYDEVQLGQTFGRSWESGNGLISYEYYDRGALDTADRERTVDAIDPQDNQPAQERHSVFVSLNHGISERVELFGNALYSNRQADSDGTLLNLDVINTVAESQQYFASGGIVFGLSQASSWQAEIAATVGRNEIDRRNFNVTGGMVSFEGDDQLDTWTFDAKMDGDLASLSGGALKLAIGAQLRDETFDSTTLTPGGDPVIQDFERDVTAVFGELFIPIVGQQNSRPGIRRLELTLAGRFEDYSDFGDSTDPKVGLLWSPTSSLDLRGSWGTSFRAPLLTDLNDFDIGTFLFPLPDPSAPSGFSNTFIVTGRNSGIGPEEADTWTVGLDFTPDSLPGFSLSLTHFGVDYDGRILNPDPVRAAEWLSNPTFAPIVDRTPNLAVIAAMIERAASVNQDFTFTNGDLSGIEVFADGRLQNFATTELRGLDLSTTYSFGSSVGDWAMNLAVTYYDKFEQTIGAGGPGAVDDLLGIVYNPADLRLRGSLSWQHNGLSANTFVNHTSGLDDNRVDPALSISSWTTVDIQLRADFGEWSTATSLEGLSIYLSANNLFDRKPPFVLDPTFSRNYDPENHDILGRFVALGVTYDW